MNDGRKMNIDIKSRPLYIARILLEQTDEDHFLTTGDLITILQEKYGISSHRTTIADDIKTLTSVGMDIETVRSSQNKYHVVSRIFDIAELKLLIDAVESSKFISEAKSTELIKKLQTQASVYNRNTLRRNLKVDSRFKPKNEEIFLIADAINSAINQQRKISFQYFSYNIRKEKQLRHKGERYIVSPYFLIWDGDCYYMVGYSEKHGGIGNFRVDRIFNVPEIMTKPAHAVPDNFDISEYVKTSFRMYNSNRETVDLICENSTMDSILDRFGTDVPTYAYDLNNFRVEANVAISHVFYAWVFGFGGKVRINGPESVKKGYVKMVENAHQLI